MEQYDQVIKTSAEAPPLNAGEAAFVSNGNLSFAKMLEQFYLMHNIPSFDPDPVKSHELATRLF